MLYVYSVYRFALQVKGEVADLLFLSQTAQRNVYQSFVPFTSVVT
jgi:hypothetical protein